MGISVGSSVSTGGNVSVLTTGTFQSRSGSTLVVIVGWEVATFTSITDSFSNTWTQIGAETTAGTVLGRMYYAQNITGGEGHTVTLTISSGQFPGMAVLEIRHGETTILDQSASNNDAASPFTANNITTTSANEILVGGIVSSLNSGAVETFTPSNSYETVVSFTNTTVANACSLAVRTVAATGTYQPSWTLSGGTSAGCFSASFIEDADQNITLTDGDEYLRHVQKAA